MAYGATVIFTIGHSNHPLERFIGLLMQHGVGTLVDVRSTPASRFNPQFNRKALEAALAASSIRYEFLGTELGARTDDPACYEDGRVSYRRLAASAPFRHGLERLRSLAAASRVAIMCAEHEPLDCHRTILIGRELGRANVPVTHILRDGTLETGAEANARLIDRLKLATPDLIAADAAGPEDTLVERAYDLQSARIAYTPARTKARGA